MDCDNVCKTASMFAKLLLSAPLWRALKSNFRKQFNRLVDCFLARSVIFLVVQVNTKSRGTLFSIFLFNILSIIYAC